MYEPKRDHRFEYIWDLMGFIEDNQCGTCAFKSDRPDYPMCGEIEAAVIEENEVPDLDDLGDDGLVCRRYREETLEEESHPDQSTLF